MKKILILLLVLSCGGLLSGCYFRPYVIQVQQGNILSDAKIDQLAIGMSKQQVSKLLGTPVLENAFSKDCWSYVYSKQVRGGRIDVKYLILHFKGNNLVRIGD